mmetsp:Transcript_57685/g.140883  ORF Transcript_57685/g.140883 Transcript_57685/m.140883 type:complete len:790 (-) Transcript_57685:76-2445(-)
MNRTNDDDGRQQRRRGKQRQQPQISLLQDCLPGVNTSNTIYSNSNSNTTGRSVSNTSLEMLLMNEEEEGDDEANNGEDCSYKEGYTTGYNYHESYHNDVSSFSHQQQTKTTSIRLHQAPAVAAEYRRKHQRKVRSLLLCMFMTLLVVAGSVAALLLFSSQFEQPRQDPSVITLSRDGQDDENIGADDDTFSRLFLSNQVRPKDGSTPPNNTSQKTTMMEMDDGKEVNRNNNNNNNNHSNESSDDDERRTKILTALKNLDEEIQGDIVLMSNKTKFLVAAQVWQSSVRPPLAVVEASSTNDVSIALPILAGLQRDYNIPFRVRSGGYTYMTDYSNIPDGIVLSLTRMNNLSFGNLTRSEKEVSGSRLADTIATTNTTLKFQPGVSAEQFMQEVLYKHGYVGIVPSAADVGMGGFVLGGGYGLQSRLYGLAIDNVVSAEAVLMNGTQVVVENGDDLFWGLLGSGGANFAVVTDIEQRVYPSNDVKLCASTKLSLEELSGFLQRLGDLESDLAPEFTLTVSGYYPPDNRTSPDISSLNFSSIGRGLDRNKNYDGDDDIGFVDLKMYWTGEDNPTSQIGLNYIETKIALLLNHTAPNSRIVYYYFSWSGMSREKEQDSLWKSVWSAQSWNGFLMPKNNTKVVWDDIVSSFEAMFRYCDYATPSISLWGGAVSKRLPNETAFPYRSALYSVGVELLVPDGTKQHTHINPRDQIHLINAIWPSIDRHLTGVYVNQPMTSLSSNDEESEDEADGFYPQAYWGTNLNKLMILKQKYDPYHSLLHQQSIPIINATAST